jgi:predicted glutamine amidotransferase
MCVIIGCIDSKPNLTILRKCHAANSDGAGVAWVDKDGLAGYKKGFTSGDQVHDFIQTLELPFIIHFRWASIGGKSPLLTHPFEMKQDSELKLEGKSEKLLIHNGTVSDYDIYLAAAKLSRPYQEPMSDSRGIAMITGNDNEKFLEKIKGNYIVIDGTIDQFRTYGDFREGWEDGEKGMIFSNFGWRSRNVASVTVVRQNDAEYESHWGVKFGGHETQDCCPAVKTVTQQQQSKTTQQIRGDVEEVVEAWWKDRLNPINQE